MTDTRDRYGGDWTSHTTRRNQKAGESYLGKHTGVSVVLSPAGA